MFSGKLLSKTVASPRTRTSTHVHPKIISRLSLTPPRVGSQSVTMSRFTCLATRCGNSTVSSPRTCASANVHIGTHCTMCACVRGCTYALRCGHSQDYGEQHGKNYTATPLVAILREARTRIHALCSSTKQNATCRGYHCGEVGDMRLLREKEVYR